MAITEKQRDARAEGVGASECAAILGLSPFASAYDVWLEKTGKVVREESEQTEAMEIGNAIEPTTAALAEKRLGCKLVKPTGTYKADNGVMLANLDRQVDKAARGFPICELKSTWMLDGWGEPGTDEVPEAVMIQVHAQMLCSDARVAHVARMLGRFGFSVSLFRVPFNADLARVIDLHRYLLHGQTALATALRFIIAQLSLSFMLVFEILANIRQIEKTAGQQIPLCRLVWLRDHDLQSVAV